MCPGLYDDLQQVDDFRKTTVIDRELSRLDVSIAALQETRLASSGSLREENYTFFWKGLEPADPCQYGVGFVVRNSLLASVEPPSGGTERILSIRLSTAADLVTIFSTYAPTLNATEKAKDRFNEELDSAVGRVPKAKPLFLLGGFNARVDSDHQSWPSCMGHHGTERINYNGQWLLELCSYYSLCITNTYFQGKPQHSVSWRHPRSKQWHQLDLIITRRPALNSVLSTRSYHSADCNTDHVLVCSKVRLLPHKLHCAKPAGRPRTNTKKSSYHPLSTLC